MSEIKTLKFLLNKINSYPDELLAVNCEITGEGFFPGARGLWNEDDESISNKPIMILGHDFGTERDYKLSIERGKENMKALTWRNLKDILDNFKIAKEKCFFTNAIMGVRTEGSAIGRSPAYNHPNFINDCREFLIEQINMQRPEIIIVLGLNVLEIISGLTPSLSELFKIKSFKKLDNQNLSVFNNIELDTIPKYKTNLVIITHPTYYHLNAKHRRINNLQGIEAETFLINSILDSN